MHESGTESNPISACLESKLNITKKRAEQKRVKIAGGLKLISIFLSYL